MMNKFIYVFSEEAKDILLTNNYKLLKNDIKNNIYVFENKPAQCISFENINHVLADTLTF